MPKFIITRTETTRYEVEAENDAEAWKFFQRQAHWVDGQTAFQFEHSEAYNVEEVHQEPEEVMQDLMNTPVAQRSIPLPIDDCWNCGHKVPVGGECPNCKREMEEAGDLY